MSTRSVTILVAASIFVAAPPAPGADLRLKVSNKVLGNKTDGDTRSSQRQLTVDIDNRDRTVYEGVTVEWIVIARDIRTRKLSIAGSGSKMIDIPAREAIEVNSDPYSLSKTDGEVKQIEQNRNRPDLPQFTVDPDSGTRYAGYIVVLKKGDEVIAEAATAGMKRRVQGLIPKKNK